MIPCLYFNSSITTPVMGSKPAAGADQSKVTTYKDGALLVDDQGLIAAVGDRDEVMMAADALNCELAEVDCDGAAMIPGFVDPHTHICFVKPREKEFAMRLAGKSYLEILQAGGGILNSVKATAEASEEELYEVTLGNVLSALNLGTTTMEIKSGYGLDTETELKQLRVIDRIRRETPLDICITFMGAHAVPQAFKTDPDAYVELVINEMLPAVKAQGIAEYFDVFCETGVFSLEQSRRMLQAARDMGFKLRIHADEVDDNHGAELAAELNTVSAEHLLAAGDKGLAAMGKAGVIADLLPATAYSLKKPYARARDMIDRFNVPVALSTDCNPGSCYCESMPFVFGLGVMNMNMTVEEALVATTLNSAWSVGMQHKVGSLEKGKQADFLLLEGESPAILAYHAGVSPVIEVYKKGLYVS